MSARDHDLPAIKQSTIDNGDPMLHIRKPRQARVCIVGLARERAKVIALRARAVRALRSLRLIPHGSL